MMTPAQCAQEIREEIGSWGLGQLGEQGLADAVHDTADEAYHDLDEAGKAAFVAAVDRELFG